MDKAVAVVGGTGRTGRLMVRRLLDQGEQVRVVSRDVRRARGRLPGRVELYPADVREADSLLPALAGCSAVIYCVEPGTADVGPERPETTMHLGVRHALAAATAVGDQPHFVLVSQIHSTHRVHPLNAFGRMLDWRRAGEEEVRYSGLPYTVVRPGWLTDQRRPDEGVRLEQGDHATGYVSRADLAEACVQALYSPHANGVTFEIFNRKGATPTWEQAFSGLQWDRVAVS